MRHVEGLYRLALHAYPASHREHDSGVMLTTLMEADHVGLRWVVADVIDLLVNGVQKRLGLSADRVLGRSLAIASIPGLVMAAVYCVLAFVFGEEVDAIPTAWPHMGPFSTVAPIVYLLWVLAGLAVIFRPRWARRLATVGILVTVAAVPVGGTFFARPPLLVLAIPAALALPALFAPLDTRVRPVRWVVGGAVMTTAVMVLAESSLHTQVSVGLPVNWYFGPGAMGTWFYTSGMAQLAYVAVYVGALAVLSAALLAFRHRLAQAGALAILSLPWIVVAALDQRGALMVTRDGPSAGVVDAALVAMLTWIVVAAWARGAPNRVPLFS